MHTLADISAQERKELARSLANALYELLQERDMHDLNSRSFAKDAFAVLGKSDLLHESNFYGEGFSDAQAAKLKEFEDKQKMANKCDKLYDEICGPHLHKLLPGYVLSSSKLHRSWMTTEMAKEFCTSDSPLATLTTPDAIEDEDHSNESNDDNDGESDESDESDEEDSENDDDSDDDSDDNEYDSDDEATKALDRADEREAEDSDSDSDSGSGSGSGNDSGNDSGSSSSGSGSKEAAVESPRKRTNPTRACEEERAHAIKQKSASCMPTFSDMDSDLSDA
ncbi:MAG: hypothetical protein CMB11_04950 [Euryarchaeota archaeon]|nr:hypothetical protein [Euryarchaeota archaeon]